MGLQLSKWGLLSPTLGLLQVQQALPNLSMGDHPHLGSKSSPNHQVWSRLALGHIGSSGVVGHTYVDTPKKQSSHQQIKNFKIISIM